MDERAVPHHRQGHPGSGGLQRPHRRRSCISRRHVAQMRLHQQPGGDGALQRSDDDPQDQHVPGRVGEDVGLDLHIPVRVAGGQPIGQGQGSSGGIGVEIGDLGGGPGGLALHEQAVGGADRQAQVLQLGLVDQAVHGLGDMSSAHGEPDPGPGPVGGIGLVGGADAGLAGRLPGPRPARGTGGDTLRGPGWSADGRHQGQKKGQRRADHVCAHLVVPAGRPRSPADCGAECHRLQDLNEVVPGSVPVDAADAVAIAFARATLFTGARRPADRPTRRSAVLDRRGGMT